MESRKYCKITYNNKTLDDIIPGYITINVEGRGLLSPKIETVSIDGRDGDYVIGQSYPARDIRVYFKINASKNIERLDIIDKLDIELRVDKDVEFSFGDQEGYWVGRYSQAQDISYDYFTGVGYFILHCQNPYRHMPLVNFKGTVFVVKIDNYKKLKLNEINAIVTNTSEVRILNKTTGEVISLRNLKSLGELKITNDEIKLNGQNIKNRLDPSVSTWKEFRISNNDEISISGVSSANTSIRGYL